MGSAGSAWRQCSSSSCSGADASLTGGEARDLVGADHLLPDMQAEVLIADKAFDADQRVIAPLAAAGKTAVIPPKANRKSQRSFDRHLYQARHLIDIYQTQRLSRFSSGAHRTRCRYDRRREATPWRGGRASRSQRRDCRCIGVH